MGMDSHLLIGQAMSYNLGFIRTVIYKLKRQYGLRLHIYHDVSTSTDLVTGVKTITKNEWYVQRAILMPQKLHRNSLFAYVMSREFRYGSVVELNDRVVIIDRKDLPKDIAIGTENWYVGMEGKRFEIIETEDYEHKAAYKLTLRELKGAQRDTSVVIDVKQGITIGDQIQ